MAAALFEHFGKKHERQNFSAILHHFDAARPFDRGNGEFFEASHAIESHGHVPVAGAGK